MGAFGFLLHGDRELAAQLGLELGEWLVERTHEVRFLHADAGRLGRPEWGYDADELALGLDLLVGVGGDGTMLDAVALAAISDVPVLGVNVGQMGYLTAVEPAGARSALKRFLAGAYDIEERMRLAAHIERHNGVIE